MNPNVLFGSAAGIAAWSILSSGAVPKMHEKKSGVALVMLDPTKTDNLMPPGLRFQYFPETIQDTKGVNYSQKAVPGGSLPLYQWINGAERTIAFTATFSSDIDLSIGNSVDWLGVPARFGGGGTLSADVKSIGVEDRNVDIVAALMWLRRMMIPGYSATAAVAPPPKLLLWVPGSGIGLFGGATDTTGENRSADTVLCLMTQCDIEMKAFFPSGTPRFATVQLAFAEIAQIAGVVKFPGEYYPDQIMMKSVSEGLYGRGGYNLRPK